MKKKLTCTLSNVLDFLYLRFSEEVAVHKDPFERKIVVVPNEYIKRWLQVRLAGKCGMGIEYILVEEAIPALLSLIGEKEQAGNYPQFSQLVASSVRYVLEAQRTLPEKNAYDVAVKIAKTFWQRHIWGIAEEQVSSDPFIEEIAKRLEYTIPSFEKVEIPNDLEATVHLFGFSTLCPGVHEFFQKISFHIFVKYWFFSPCMMFWTDVRSDKEAHALKQYARKIGVLDGEIAHLDELLFDRNPLLANIGALGRNFAALLENSNIKIEEAYAMPKIVMENLETFDSFRHEACIGESDQEPTLLSLLQADMLTLHGKRTHKIVFEENDYSIQVHKTSAPLQEVQVAYGALVEWVERNCISTLFPGDIQVYAPEISRYAPYIDRVFGQKGALFNYEIVKKPRSIFISGLKAVLDLFEGRLTNQGLCILFQNTLFADKAQIHNDEVRFLEAILSELDFFWGVDSEDRKARLQEEGYSTQVYSKNGTWKAFEEKVVEHIQKGALDTNASEILGKCITVVRVLIEKRKMVRSFTGTTKEWADHFAAICEYFLVDSRSSYEETEGVHQVQEALTRLQQSGKEKTFSFVVAKNLFLTCLDSCTPISRAFGSVVSFSNLGTIRNVPARAVLILGMSEDQFPSGGLDLFKLGYSLQKGRMPQYDLEKYLFCEALFSAKDLLCTIFQSYSFEERSERAPAACISDMLLALDYGAVISGRTPSEVIVESQSEESFVVSEKSNVQERFFFDKEQMPHSHDREYIDVRELFTAARSPLQLYIRQQCGLVLSQDKKKKGAHFIEYERMYRARLGEEEIPPSYDRFMDTMLRCRLDEEKRDVTLACAKHRIDFRKIFSVEFSSQCKDPLEVKDRHWLVPAPRFVDGARDVTLEGRVNLLHTEGELFLGARTTNTVVRQWPQLLLRAYLCSILPIAPLDAIYFLKDQSKTAVSLKDPQSSLKDFVFYARNCNRMASCLYPDVIESIISDKETLEEKVISIKNAKIQDPYFSFFLSRVSQEELQEALLIDKERAEKLFKEIL